jgi:hypothetical protein
VDGVRDFMADVDRGGIGAQGDGAGVEAREFAAAGEGGEGAGLGEERREFSLESVADGVALMGWNAVQHEFLDVQLEGRLRVER